MTLGDCYGGDIVVVNIDGELKFLYVGNVLWQGRARKKMLGDRNTKKVEREPSVALVSDVDPETLRVNVFTWSAIDAGIEVVDVVERGVRRRELERRTRDSRMQRITGKAQGAAPEAEQGEVDPLASKANAKGGW